MNLKWAIGGPLYEMDAENSNVAVKFRQAYR